MNFICRIKIFLSFSLFSFFFFFSVSTVFFGFVIRSPMNLWFRVLIFDVSFSFPFKLNHFSEIIQVNSTTFFLSLNLLVFSTYSELHLFVPTLEHFLTFLQSGKELFFFVCSKFDQHIWRWFFLYIFMNQPLETRERNSTRSIIMSFIWTCHATE